ncbi:hypothetical protein OCU04_012159 [Sclerotinia nivalis]|uniref:2EXR domain-containing protein n=1 Tax=Sclerotinia nivalis TaxID=352851 RepID=A0A9X0AE52_9HELO|nr:hypothetical protein OCU04_012159 [Sclerotinia nivalis]
MQHLVKVKHLLSVRAFRQCLKRPQPDKKGKHTPNVELTLTDIDSQVQTDALTGPTFTIFPNLPLELQRKIWEFAAITHPRAIEVHPRYKRNTNKPVAYFYYFFGMVPRHRYYTTTSAIPTNLLHTCSESRNIALRQYSFHFFFGQPFYFNADRDILFVKGDAILDFSRTRNRMITHTPIEEGCTSSIVAKYKIRFLAIDYKTTDPFLPWVRLQSAEQKRSWNIYFWSEYVLNGITVEKIFLVYTEQDQRNEAVEDAKAMYEHGKSKMKLYSRAVGTNGSSVREIYCKGIELRRRYGLGFKAPPVEAILDTELIQ